MRTATHIIVLSEEIVFCNVGAQHGVAHQVDEAQTQAFESRYSAGKEQVGSQTAESRPSPSDPQRGISGCGNCMEWHQGSQKDSSVCLAGVSSVWEALTL